MNTHFDAVAKDWEDDDFKHTMSRSIADAIESRIDFNSHMSIMDFGAGTGLLSGNFYDKVAQITAVDTSQAMLNQLGKKEDKESKRSLCCQDIIKDPLETKFDLIVSAMAMHHVEDTKALLKSLYTHLKPQAKLAIADLDSEDGSFHPASMGGIFHLGFNRDSLKELLFECGFSDITFDTAFTISKEGTSFPLFLLTARKAS